MTNTKFLGCDLATLRAKWILTNSISLSEKLLEGRTHFGAQPHSVQSLVRFFYELGEMELSTGSPLTAESLELFGENLKSKLSPKNYFKEAFDLPGLRSKVFDCLEEMRVAGYEPRSVPKKGIENVEKLESLREIFEHYNSFIIATHSTDYPAQLKGVTASLQSGKFDHVLKNTDLLIPFPLDLRGMESSFYEVLGERAKAFLPSAASTTHRSKTDPTAKSLEKFKDGLGAFLERKPYPAQVSEEPLDKSLVLKAALKSSDAVSDVFAWMDSQSANVGRYLLKQYTRIQKLELIQAPAKR